MNRISIFLLLLGISLLLVLIGLGASFLFIWNRNGEVPPPDLSSFDVPRPAISGVSEEDVLTSEKNAYSWLKLAVGAIDFPPESYLMLKESTDESAKMKEKGELVGKNTRVYALLAKAGATDICIAPVVKSGEETPLLPRYKDLRDLLEFKAEVETASGDCSAALKTSRSLVDMGLKYQRHAESATDWLVGASLVLTGLRQARIIANNPGVNDGQLKSLADYLASVTINSGFEYALKAEFRTTKSQLDEEVPNFRSPLARVAQVYQPNRTHTLLANSFLEMLQSTHAPRTQVRLKTFDEIQMASQKGKWQLFLSKNAVGFVLLNILVPALGRTVDAKYAEEAAIAATRLVVACQRFQREQRRFPETLQELVPRFLDSVPPDPYDGNPFRFDRAKGTVYSIGRDLKDSGGSTKPRPEFSKKAQVSNTATEDEVYALDGSYPRGSVDTRSSRTSPEENTGQQ